MQWRVLALSVSIGFAIACAANSPTERDPTLGSPDAAGNDESPPGDAGDAAVIPTEVGDDGGWKNPPDDGGTGQTVCQDCPVGYHCDEVVQVCVEDSPCQGGAMTPPTCEGEGVQCGLLSYLDVCDGQIKEVDCLECADGSECDRGTCRCKPELDSVLCLGQGVGCGLLQTSDRCGDEQTVDCGQCDWGEVCRPESRACQVLATCDTGCSPCRDDGFCVECLVSADCDQGRVCEPSLGLCLECLQDSDCLGDPARPRCVAGSGACAECVRGTDCPSGSCDLARHVCGAAVPANDGCSGAQPVAVGGAPVAGTTVGAGADAQGTCAALAPDVAFAFTVPATGWYTLTAHPQDAALRPAVQVRLRCGEAGSELGCAASAAAGDDATLEARLLQGPAVAFVSGLAGQGAFTFAVEPSTAAHAAPPGDTCAGPFAELTLAPASGEWVAATASASTLEAGNGFSSSCAYSDGPDVVFPFTLAAAHQVTAEVTRRASTPAYLPSVYLRSSCDDFATEEACSFFGTAEKATAVAGNLPAGQHFAIVDGAARSAGDFDLTLTLGPPLAMADLCPGYEVAAPDAGSSVTLVGDTAAATGGREGSCGGSGPEAVYHLRFEAASTTLSARVAASGGLSPVLYLRRGSCEGTAAEGEVGCARESTGEPAAAEASFASLAPGDYWLFVDGFGGTRGPYTLELSW